MKFVIEGRGDMDVGIHPTHWDVTIPDYPYPWSADAIKMWKEFLSEADDNQTLVFTQEEYDDYINQQNGMIE
jgi:hypothetical protein